MIEWIEDNDDGNKVRENDDGKCIECLLEHLYCSKLRYHEIRCEIVVVPGFLYNIRLKEKKAAAPPLRLSSRRAATWGGTRRGDLGRGKEGTKAWGRE